jgi:hypothetical protein
MPALRRREESMGELNIEHSTLNIQEEVRGQMLEIRG